MTSKQQTAQDAYAAQMMKAFEMATIIQDTLSNMPAPDGPDSGSINWSLAAEATEIVRRLKEVTDFMQVPQYAYDLSVPFPGE